MEQINVFVQNGKWHQYMTGPLRHGGHGGWTGLGHYVLQVTIITGRLIVQEGNTLDYFVDRFAVVCY